MQIRTDSSFEPVTFVSPTGHRHGVDEYGSDGVVLAGNSQTNWKDKTFTWDELHETGFSAYIGDTEVEITTVKQSIPGTPQPE